MEVGAADFHREVTALERFTASANSHIVPLLCTFERDGINHMIFPWAEYNLYQYWRRYTGNFSRFNVKHQRWISSQLLGLADALDTIHNPRDALGGPFGRHGDIKPENILWFQSSKESQGIFVLSDLGLAKLHRDLTGDRGSRTKGFGFTAAYRPPEVDMANVKLSRSLDIWSLGCVLLEMACWLLGGFEDVRNLSSVRTSGSVGIDSNAFFSAKPSQHGEQYDFMVKPQVTDVRQFLDRERGTLNVADCFHIST